MTKIKKMVEKAIKLFSMKELQLLPASLAYNFFLAFIPLITIIVIVSSLFSISIDSVINLLNDILPSSISEIIINIINGKEFDLTIGFLNIITFVIACNGTYAIISASNSLYKVEKSDTLKDHIRSLIILIIIVCLLLFLLIVPILGGKILELLEKYKLFSNIIDELLLIYKGIRWPITFFIIFFNIKLIYTISPSVKIQSEDTTVGAFITTVGWVLFTAIFGYYIKYFAKYDLIYGSLSSLMILLIWLYALSYILILGIVINTRKYNKN